MLQVAISATGAVGPPTAIASGFASADNPAVVNLPGGGLEVFFGGIQCSASLCPAGLFGATSSNGGATWTTPALLFNADQAYGSDVNAAVLSDGTLFQTWAHTTGTTVHRGLDTSFPDYNYQAALGAPCCGIGSNLAADSAGHLQLAWDSDATGFDGVWSQAVTPSSGAPSGAAQRMPGTAGVGTINGRTPIVSVPGHPLEFFVAFPSGSPTRTKVLLWQVGAPNVLTVANDPQDHNAVALAADTSGRLWVFWARQTSRGPHVFARRVGFAGPEPVIDMGAPVGTSSIPILDGDVSPAGNPEALALVVRTSGAAGTYYARGPQAAPLPAPANGRSVNVSPVSGIVLVKPPGQKTFQLLTVGEQIRVGATLDTAKGRVRLTSARAGKGTQTADFYGGRMVVGQRRGKTLTALRLTGGNRAICALKAPRVGPLAQAARRRRRHVRHVWGNGHGSFSTGGSYASATVRGTIWLTEDDCEGTLIRVQRGTVTVRDLVRRKTIIVRAPHSYFAPR